MNKYKIYYQIIFSIPRNLKFLCSFMQVPACFTLNDSSKCHTIEVHGGNKTTVNHFCDKCEYTASSLVLPQRPRTSSLPNLGFTKAHLYKAHLYQTLNLPWRPEAIEKCSERSEGEAPNNGRRPGRP